jgi:two-component system nitrogen regulation sensor histidine kinase NtrY
MPTDNAKEPQNPSKNPEVKEKEKKRKGLIILSFLGLLFLILVQRKLLNLGPGLSSNQGVITLVSINISVLTLGFLLYLILRDLYKVFFERDDYGSLQTKMVVSFIGLSLMPTLLIFYFAYLLVGQDRKVWFSESLKDSLSLSIKVAQDSIESEERIFRLSSENALLKFSLGSFSRRQPLRAGGESEGPPESFQGPASGPSPYPMASDGLIRALGLLEDIRASEGLDTLEWYGPDGLPLSRSLGSLGEARVPPAPADLFFSRGAIGSAAQGQGLPPGTFLTETEFGPLFRLVLPVAEGPRGGPSAFGPSLSGPLPKPSETIPLYSAPYPYASSFADSARFGAQGESMPGSAEGSVLGSGQARAPRGGYLVAGSIRLGPKVANLRELKDGLLKYEAALGIERPFKVSQLTSLGAVTLVAVFLSVWIGRHLAGSLSAPVTELVEGVRRVAQGDLDFILSPTVRSGEMAQLVTAFNQMTHDLKLSYAELDERRRFVEIVLRQVSTGVLVFDNENKVLNLNEAALNMLSLEQREALASPAPSAVSDLADSLNSYPAAKRHIFLTLPDGSVLSLMAMRSRLLGEDKRALGSLITFDDVSELEKAQRLAAWREVAKRIAHEVKNPLTPISLAAQRLKRRFGEKLKDDPEGAIIEECTSVIIRQVENMRMLVDEFSQFARLPQANPRASDIVEVIEESLTLFGEAHSGIEFKLKVLRRPEVFPFDPVQIGRVVSNLLSNAANAVKGAGKVEIEVDVDELKGVVVTVKDDGPGLPPGIREKVFEPYVTSGSGQGLGLSIVKTIVTDHGGYIRVLDRKPKGTSFEFSIPYQKKPKNQQ